MRMEAHTADSIPRVITLSLRTWLLMASERDVARVLVYIYLQRVLVVVTVW